MKMLNRTGPRTAPGGIPFIMTFQVEYNPLTTTQITQHLELEGTSVDQAPLFKKGQLKCRVLRALCSWVLNIS